MVRGRLDAMLSAFEVSDMVGPSGEHHDDIVSCRVPRLARPRRELRVDHHETALVAVVVAGPHVGIEMLGRRLEVLLDLGARAATDANADIDRGAM